MNDTNDQWLMMRASELYRKRTPAELCLSKRLAEWFPWFPVQEQTVMMGYIADFYIPAASLIVEADGGVHLTDKAKEHDKKRGEQLALAGITTLRIKNRTILERPIAARNAIRDAIAAKIGTAYPQKLNTRITKPCKRHRGKVEWDSDLNVKP
jgi:very-short-patch-repair endonuclease